MTTVSDRFFFAAATARRAAAAESDPTSPLREIHPTKKAPTPQGDRRHFLGTGEAQVRLRGFAAQLVLAPLRMPRIAAPRLNVLPHRFKWATSSQSKEGQSLFEGLAFF